MKEELKELIENAPKKLVGDFNSLMIVSNGAYDGFWGGNEYDYLLILGTDCETDQWCMVSEYGDILNIENIGNHMCNIDIPEKYGVPRIFFRTPIHIDNSQELSSIMGKLV